MSGPEKLDAPADTSTRVYANDEVALEIREDLCKGAGCGICVEICAQESLAIDHRGKAVVVNLDTCNRCMRCEFMCPDFAFRVR